jgi:chemotaxis protein histidine kinase CheA
MRQIIVNTSPKKHGGSARVSRYDKGTTTTDKKMTAESPELGNGSSTPCSTDDLLLFHSPPYPIKNRRISVTTSSEGDPLESWDREELEAKYRSLEKDSFRLILENKDIVKSLNESYKTIQNYESTASNLQDELRVLTESNESLNESRKMLVENLNKTFAEQAGLESKLKAIKLDGQAQYGEDYVQRMKENRKYIKKLTIENQSLKAKLEELTGQTYEMEETSETSTNTFLTDQIDNLKEMLRNNLKEQSDLELKNDELLNTMMKLRSKLSIIKQPNPSFAIDQLRKQDPSFIYVCNTLDQKRELLSLAIHTESPDIIITVIHYLKNSLTSTIFDQILINSQEAATYYLKHLVEKEPDRKEWKRVILLTQRYDELGLFLYSTALNQTEPAKKLSKLQDCLRFIKTYSCLLHYQEEIETIIIDLSLKAIPDL